ncbi:hypothetical protein D9757_014718 [Collybiopsis confluens]|uniref:F-box domain-containing protein n=1 Tax=Collybiopsis confluens TaxID=2823264 RepID=A0A8H5FHK3_9AGAR|nr:hypothetical protein D9757_014718 [Collybiopsis confluens]
MTWVNYPSTSFRPLPFDRANRGKPSRSPFPFFQLPVEVLNDVAPHIPPADLEALALVDRDCRQLARSVQFFYVKLTYSDVSLGMLETLLAEMMLGARKESSQTLASCIRHLALDLGLSTNLKASISRDSYKVVGHPLLDSSVENYYVNSVFPANKMFQKFLKPDERALLDSFGPKSRYVIRSGSFSQIRLIKAAWERWHQEKMIDLAKVYATTFTKMKWCFIGQYQ